MKKNRNFLDWLHRERARMEAERKREGLSLKEYTEAHLKNLRKKGIMVT